MKAFSFVTLALAALAAGPAVAGIPVIDLPRLTFPDPVVTPSTKDCAQATTAEVCQPEQ